MGEDRRTQDPPAFVALSLEADRLDRYLRFLIAFITITYFFDAYDVLLMNLALPYLGRDFQASPQTLGYAVSVIGLGSMAAFFFIRLADRFGRRPVLLVSIVAYSLLTFLTAFSRGLVDYVAYQFVARALLVSGLGVGTIVLTEELPARYRGLGVGLMLTGGAFGGIVAAALFPHLLETRLGWRMLYLLGVIPVGLVLLFRNKLQETRRWRSSRREDSPQAQGLREMFRAVFQRENRFNLAVVATLVFCATLWYSSVYVFWTYFVVNERGWSPQQVSKTLMVSFVFAMLSHFLAGISLDRLGRRITAYLFFGMGGISAFFCFRAQDPLAISLLYILVIFSSGIFVVCFTVGAELFPTDIRASANAVANNLLGRVGMVIAPSLIGLLASWRGSVGEAVSLVGLAPLFCVAAVYLFVPETRERVLEEIPSMEVGRAERVKE